MIVDISIDDYHASEFVSNSKLTTFARDGARAYHDRYIARVTPRVEPSAAQLFGQAYEDLIQRPESWHDHYVVRPANIKFTSKEGKSWREAQTKVVIDQADYDSLMRMGESMSENDVACELALAARTQMTFRSEYAGLPGIQSRPDWAGIFGCAASGFRPYTLDLKTTSRFAALVSGRGVYDYRYHVQAAIAAMAMSDYGVAPTAYIIAGESVAPYRCQVVELGPDWMLLGLRAARSGLGAIARCYECGEWARVDRSIVTLRDVPRWMMEDQ